MRLSEFFLPLIKEVPSEAKITSHQLMLRAGMIRQLSSGIYNWLPLGVKVLKNVENIIRYHMSLAGCNEILMSCIQPADLWRESGRYDCYGKEMLKITDRHNNDMLFGPTNEEVVGDIFRNCVQSYKDLPLNLYQIQWKFRDEIRPRFGVMRGREFLMKDGYSFDIDLKSAVNTYNNIFLAYLKTFKHIGLNVIPVQADNGEIGGEMSHEFHVLADTGESKIYYDKKFDVLAEDVAINFAQIKELYAAAEEKHDWQNCPIPKDQILEKRGIEVGHIFHFGTKYSEPMNIRVNNKEGRPVNVEMGSYGIGVSRIVAAIIEANHDDKGIIWPETVAPFKVAVINLKKGNDECDSLADNIYNILLQQIEVIYDDTKASPGNKFATNDLIGTPWQIIIGPKHAGQNQVELKHRRTGETELMTSQAAIAKLLGSQYV